ncbi:MAG TPA: class I SAM-dependent methyltransferase [Bryobacteraceae bacterium]|jgi:SAM-dependent methyltransferase|nr:class I SAM-dependent methyltransferase [Bryobacteraceae bacterium]
MPEKVDLYNSAYGNYGLDTYVEIRKETYGEDLGQTSWVTAEESSEIPRLLEIDAACQVLEIGCGSGRYALRVAEQTGCHIIGLDVNPHGIRNANEIARQENLDSLVTFEECDASRKLPFEDSTFDAIFSNDVLCHLPGRVSVLAELGRVLKPGGRLLFSDALIVGGLLTNEEVATRSSIGIYVFSPPGTNEQLIQIAGLRVIHGTDTTGSAEVISKRWHDARQRRAAELVAVEGMANFSGLQRFLSCVHTLTAERRLLRWVYLARKEA